MARLAQYDVTPAQYSILKCLWNQDGQTAKQIAGTLCLEGSTISGIMDRLEQKNLLKRIPNLDDRRSIKVFLTESGVKLQSAIEREIENANEFCLREYNDIERVLLKRFLVDLARKT
jgi:MarR family transcriptional regulator, organic hydroperoxide resistance regulator